MTDQPIISCAGVGKTFRIPVNDHVRLRDRVLHPTQRSSHRIFRALDDVSFAVRPGEFFGIVGRNGSGKSTLLKIVAGIYRPSQGTVAVRGRIASFIELGIGFNPEMSGRDNLFINGALLGLTRKELRRRYDSIVEFAELQDFMDLKLRNFSSGMQVRLAFSVAIQSGSEILLTDEVLAVGDERFQKKCFDVFHDLKKAGKTIVFVTHDMGAVQRFCDRAMLLERGRNELVGRARDVAQEYHAINMTDPIQVEESAPQQVVIGRPVCLVDDTETELIPRGKVVTIRFPITANIEVSEPIVRLTLSDHLGNTVMELGSRAAGAKTGSFGPGDSATLEYSFDNHMSGGSYYASIEVLSPEATKSLGIQRDAMRLRVPGSEPAGVITPPHSVRVLQSALPIGSPEQRPNGTHAL